MLPLIDTKEAARQLSVTPITIRQWLKANKLRGFKMFRAWRIAQVDLDRFREQQANMAPA